MVLLINLIIGYLNSILAFFLFFINDDRGEEYASDYSEK